MRKKVDLEIKLKDKSYFDLWVVSSDGAVFRNHKWVVPVDAVTYNKSIGISYILKDNHTKQVEVLTSAWNYLIPIDALAEESQNLLYSEYPEIFL